MSRAEIALQRATDAFWASVAADYPEASTGDLHPEVESIFSRWAAVAIESWVQMNAPAPDHHALHDPGE